MAPDNRPTTDSLSDDVRENLKNQGAEAMFAALHWLEEHVPDAEIQFKMPCEQQLSVERNGIRYAVKQVGGPTTGYRYAVGAELPTTDSRTDRERDRMHYPHRSNACTDYAEAITLLAKSIMADPRQDDLAPWSDHPKHITVRVPIPG